MTSSTQGFEGLKEFLDTFPPRLQAAEELIDKADPDTRVVHQNRVQAKQNLQQMLHEITMYYKMKPEHNSPGTLTSYVISLALCKTLMLCGRALTASMETIEGYLATESAVNRLEAMQANGQPLQLDDMSSVLPQFSAGAKKKHTAGTPKLIKSRGARKSMVGAAMALECYVAMAMATNQWGDPQNSLACLQAAECLRDDFENLQQVNTERRRQDAKTEIAGEAQQTAQWLEAKRAEERDEQAALLAEKLAKKRAKKAAAGGTSP